MGCWDIEGFRRKLRALMVRRIDGDSMLPKLKPGNLVIGNRLGKYRAGDLVIVSHDGIEKIKRISQIDGDKVYVLGDNPPHSTDSRHFGWLPADAILAKVIWPRLAPVAIPVEND